MTPRIWLIAGPTASGKSALALRLAEEIGAEIVGADALQLYRDIPVLSAAPSDAERARVPHHLVGVADAADGWSAGRWLRAAREVLDEIAARGRPAVVVGGTGLYFRALTQGLAEVPPVPAAVREQGEAEYAALGEAAFRERLAQVDAAAAARISPGDRQRLARAWEVYATTGRALSDWQADNEGALPPDSWRAVAIEPERQALYDRCDARFAAMTAQGALDEVRALAARNLSHALPALKAVGYPELAAHLRGELPLPQAVEAARRETRRYAKRQSTWLRGQMTDWPRIGSLNPEDQWRQFLALNPGLTLRQGHGMSSP
jgi:tRNA dimethylallyltransferase